VHRLQSIFQFKQSSECQLERMLIGVVDGTDWEIQKRCAGLFDVVPEYMRYRLAFEERNERSVLAWYVGKSGIYKRPG